MQTLTKQKQSDFVTLLVDGNNMAHRARHVFDLSHNGKDVSVTYGFMHTIQACVKKFKPDACVVCWDGGTPNYRREKVPEYKANRSHGSDDPEEYQDFLRQMRELCDYVFPMTGMISLRGHNIEADDLMYHASRMVKGKKIIITSDKDLFQAIDDDTKVYNPARDTLYDQDLFETEYGISIHDYLDWKALIGDSSDNIPGVRGIGEKTATKLFTEFHSLTNIVNVALGHPVDKTVKMSDKTKDAILAFGLDRIIKNVYVMALYADRAGVRRVIYDGFDNYTPANKGRLKNYFMRNAFISLMESFPQQLSTLKQPVLKNEVFRMPVICQHRSPVA